MSKKISALSMVLLLSACGQKTETVTTHSESNSYAAHHSTGSSGFEFGILGELNLNFQYDYNMVNKNKTAKLPDVEVVMHPRFTSDDVVGTYLSERRAELSERGTIPSGIYIPGLLLVGASMPSSKLKAVIHTPAYEKEVLESDVNSVQDAYKAVFSLADRHASLVVVPLWKDSEQSKDMNQRLYKVLFTEALAAAKVNNELDITVFASSKEQEDFMGETISALYEELGINPKSLKGSAVGNSSSSSSALSKLSETTTTTVNLSQGSFLVNGAATSVGNFQLMGVMSEGAVNQRQSTLMVGMPLGQHMIAIGTELGFENKTLSYGMAKLWGVMNVLESFKLSASISATHEKVPTFRSIQDHYGMMTELSTHYSEQLSPTLKVSADAGLRGAFSRNFEMGWFGLVSLDNGSFKTSAFVSSKDFGVNFGVEQ